MEAIILAGGFGTRLRSVVSDLPKPMAPVAGGRPFLEVVMDRLQCQGFNHIVLSTGYKHEAIESHFGDRYKDIELSYARETTPLGTGGGMRNSLQYCREDDIVVLNGDTLFSIDYQELFQFYHSHRTRLAVVLRNVDDVSRYGSVTIGDDGLIVGFTEKDASSAGGTINGGIYMMHRSLLEEMPPETPFSFEKEILQTKYKTEKFYAYPSDAFFIDIGIPEDYLKMKNLS